MVVRWYVKIGSKIHRAYMSEAVTRRVFQATIQARINRGYELLEESTPNRAVLKRADKSTTRKLIMRMYTMEE